MISAAPSGSRWTPPQATGSPSLVATTKTPSGADIDSASCCQASPGSKPNRSPISAKYAAIAATARGSVGVVSSNRTVAARTSRSAVASASVSR